MKKIKKTQGVFWLILALVGVIFTNIGILSNVRVIVSAVEIYTYDDFEYAVLDDSTVIITKYIGSALSVDIPSEIDGKFVTEIDGMAFYECKLTSLNIPNSVIAIGEFAFGYCTELKSLKIGNSLAEIRYGAFYHCESLTSVNMPSRMIEIGAEAFEGCVGLTDVYFSGNEIQWNNISVDLRYNKPLASATIHYNYKVSEEVVEESKIVIESQDKYENNGDKENIHTVESRLENDNSSNIGSQILDENSGDITNENDVRNQVDTKYEQNDDNGVNKTMIVIIAVMSCVFIVGVVLIVVLMMKLKKNK